MTALGLRGGREDRLGKTLGLPEAGWHRVPEHRAGALVVGPRRPEEVAAGDALETNRLRGLHQHRPACDVGSGGLGEVGGIRRHEVVGDDVGGLLEPERRQRGEHAAFVGDEVVEHDVEHRDAVGRDHEHAVVIDLVELADLARIVVRERDVAHGESSTSTARAACATARSRSKQASSRSADRCVGDLGVLTEHVAERAPFRPRAGRGALDHAVRVVVAVGPTRPVRASPTR